MLGVGLVIILFVDCWFVVSVGVVLRLMDECYSDCGYCAAFGCWLMRLFCRFSCVLALVFGVVLVSVGFVSLVGLWLFVWCVWFVLALPHL